MGGEEFAGSRVTEALQAAPDKIGLRQFDSDRIGEGLLVIWHSIQSPLPASARTSAGRSLLADKSEKGK